MPNMVNKREHIAYKFELIRTTEYRDHKGNLLYTETQTEGKFKHIVIRPRRSGPT
jgi:hypothetical protein